MNTDFDGLPPMPTRKEHTMNDGQRYDSISESLREIARLDRLDNGSLYPDCLESTIDLMGDEPTVGDISDYSVEWHAVLAATMWSEAEVTR